MQDKLGIFLAKALKMKETKITYIVIDILYLIRPNQELPEINPIWTTLYK